MLTSILRYINPSLYTPTSLRNSYTTSLVGLIPWWTSMVCHLDKNPKSLGFSMLFHQKWRERFQFSKSSRGSCFTLCLYEWHKIFKRSPFGWFVAFSGPFKNVILRWPWPFFFSRSFGSVHFALHWWLNRQEEVQNDGVGIRLRWSERFDMPDLLICICVLFIKEWFVEGSDITLDPVAVDHMDVFFQFLFDATVSLISQVESLLRCWNNFQGRRRLRKSHGSRAWNKVRENPKS